MQLRKPNRIFKFFLLRLHKMQNRDILYCNRVKEVPMRKVVNNLILMGISLLFAIIPGLLISNLASQPIIRLVQPVFYPQARSIAATNYLTDEEDRIFEVVWTDTNGLKHREDYAPIAWIFVLFCAIILFALYKIGFAIWLQNFIRPQKNDFDPPPKPLTESQMQELKLLLQEKKQVEAMDYYKLHTGATFRQSMFAISDLIKRTQQM